MQNNPVNYVDPTGFQPCLGLECGPGGPYWGAHSYGGWEAQAEARAAAERAAHAAAGEARARAQAQARAQARGAAAAAARGEAQAAGAARAAAARAQGAHQEELAAALVRAETGLYGSGPPPGAAAGAAAAARAGFRQPTLGGEATAWEAARAALQRYNPVSIARSDPSKAKHVEYGGLIYEQGGRYHYTEAVVGEDEDLGRVDPWAALRYVPEDARNRIVGDYHTHGAPGKDPTAGETFSGVHADAYVQPSEPGTFRFVLNPLPSGTSRGDLATGRAALSDHSANILNPATYTMFLGTPRGRFGVYVPATGTIFLFSPDPRLRGGKAVPAASYSAR